MAHPGPEVTLMNLVAPGQAVPATIFATDRVSTLDREALAKLR